MDPIFIILTIVFHFATIIFLKLIVPPDYSEKLKKMKQLEEEKKKKIVNNITNANIKNNPITPSMMPTIIKGEKSKYIGKTSGKVDTVKKRQGDILEINKNSYSIKINDEEKDLFKIECEKLCEKTHNCKRKELKQDFNKFLECRDKETACKKEC
jgi:hypothetical protein